MGRMRQINKVLWLLIVLSVVLAFSISFAEATVIGANKGVLNYKNVLKNGYAEEPVTLTTDTDFNLSVNYRVEGDVADWIRLDPPVQPFFISKDHPYTVKVIVEPPSDARIDQYSGYVRFITGALAGPEGQFGTAVRTAINLRLGLGVSGQEILSCRVNYFEMEDVEEGYPLEVQAVITNDGNVRIRPEFIMEFWNQDQTVLVQTLRFTSSETIFPTVQTKLFSSLDHNLSIGQYWVNVRTPMCGDAGGSFLTMSILERGEVSDQGELLGIENTPWVKVGDIVPIDVVFVNLGARVVAASFKGTITSGSKDNIFKILKTDPIDVMPGETAKLRTYFNPLQEGQYIVSGRVLFNRKLSFEKSSVINANPSGVAPSEGLGFWNATNLFFMVIVAIIIFLLILIIQKKRSLKR